MPIASIQPLVIVGIGGHGRETLDVMEAVNRHQPAFEFLGFLDDEADEEVLARRGASVLGPIARLADIEAEYVIGIGLPAARRRIDEFATRLGRIAATLIHPTASIGSDVELGAGAILAAGSRITTNVRTGRHVHCNVSATIAHDCRIGSYVSLSPGAHLAGNVTLGDQVFIGTGAVVAPGCTIRDGTVVGAGAAVVGDLPAHVTAVGVPARILENANL